MNFKKFTVKSQEAIEKASQLAQEKGNQAIDVSHLLKGVFDVSDSVTSYLFGKLGVNYKNVVALCNQLVDSQPKVSGGEPYLSREVNNVLQKSVALATKIDARFL